MNPPESLNGMTTKYLSSQGEVNNLVSFMKFPLVSIVMIGANTFVFHQHFCENAGLSMSATMDNAQGVYIQQMEIRANGSHDSMITEKCHLVMTAFCMVSR